MSGTAAAVAMSGVGVTFGAGRPNAVTALEGIDLTIQPGEFVSLIGPSGCGKSTLLRVVADLLSPSSGEVRLGDRSASEARANRDYGMVFQSATLLDWRKILANVELPLEIMGFDPDERRARAREMLELVRLSEFEDHYPWQLSGGMQQRVAIARALSFKPSILLMDEPFGALDEMTREHMQMELLNIWQTTGTTVIFVTHSIPEAVFLSTRVVVMSPRPGRITDLIDIGLGLPRRFETRENQQFFELITSVREALRRVDPAVSEPWG